MLLGWSSEFYLVVKVWWCEFYLIDSERLRYDICGEIIIMKIFERFMIIEEEFDRYMIYLIL